MELAADARPDARQPRGGRPLRRLQPDERRLPPQPARDGRRASGRHEAAVPARLARPGVQRGAEDDPPAELPRPAARPSLVPARRASGLTAGGSSIPEVRRLLAVLAAGKRVAEVGTAYGLGAQALAPTAREGVTLELDPERARVAREALAGLPNVEALEGDWAELLPPRAPFELLFMDGGGWKHDLAQARRMLEPLPPGGLPGVDDMTPGYGPG